MFHLNVCSFVVVQPDVSANRGATQWPMEWRWGVFLMLTWFFFGLLKNTWIIYVCIYKPAELFFLCLPSDMSSSSNRLMPMFWVRVCRLEGSVLEDAVLADVLSPIRSTSAELLLPALVREYWSVILQPAKMLSKCWTMAVHTSQPFLAVSLKTSAHVHLLGCEGVLMPSFDTSSPFTSCLYKLMTCVRLSLACKISAVGREEAQQQSGFRIFLNM